jgi:hypothetical protein
VGSIPISRTILTRADFNALFGRRNTLVPA